MKGGGASSLMPLCKALKRGTRVPRFRTDCEQLLPWGSLQGAGIRRDGEGSHSRQAKQINKRWGNGGGDLDMDNIAYQCNRNPLWLQIYRPALQSLPYQRDGGRLPAPLLHSRRCTHTYMFTYTYIEAVCDSQRLLEKSAI